MLLFRFVEFLFVRFFFVLWSTPREYPAHRGGGGEGLFCVEIGRVGRVTLQTGVLSLPSSGGLFRWSRGLTGAFKYVHLYSRGKDLLFDRVTGPPRQGDIT